VVLSTPKKRPRIFYGWYVIAVSVLGAFMAAGAGQFLLGVMLKPISSEFGWSRTAISGAATAATLVSGLFAPFVGRLVDRRGPRLISTVGVLALGGALFALASVHAIWQFYAAYMVARVVSSNTLSGVVPRTTAVNWFRRKRGRVLGITQMAVPLGGSALALLAQVIMGNGLSWRVVFVVFGALTLLLLLPVALVLRRRPEDMGLLPDGDEPGQRTTPASGTQLSAEYSWTLSQARRTSALWLVIAAMGVASFSTGAISFHLVAYYTDQRLGTGIAVVALSAYSFSGAIANGIWGFLVEHVSERYLAAGTMILAGGLVLFLMTVTSAAAAITFAVLFGLAARGETSIMMMILAQYFGRLHFGLISGFTTPFQLVALGLGPLAASLAYDFAGTYLGIFAGIAVAYLAAAMLLWMARKPIIPLQQQHAPSLRERGP
jgi:MFS family permease